MSRHYQPHSTDDLRAIFHHVYAQTDEADSGTRRDADVVHHVLYALLLNEESFPLAKSALVQKDMKIDMDYENIVPDGDDGSDPNEPNIHGSTIFRTTPGGLPYARLIVGGDWQLPVSVITYFDGESIRCYIPTKGNLFNPKTKAAIGDEMDDQGMLPPEVSDMLRKKLPWAKFDENGYPDDQSRDWTLMEGDIDARIVPKGGPLDLAKLGVTPASVKNAPVRAKNEHADAVSRLREQIAQIARDAGIEGSSAETIVNNLLLADEDEEYGVFPKDHAELFRQTAHKTMAGDVIEYSYENVYQMDAGGSRGIFVTPTGVPYLRFAIGGDWEVPVGLFVWHDGTWLRSYLPTTGNLFNPTSNCAIGSEKNEVDPAKLILLLPWAKMRKDGEGINDESHDWTLMEEEFCQIALNSERAPVSTVSEQTPPTSDRAVIPTVPTQAPSAEAFPFDLNDTDLTALITSLAGTTVEPTIDSLRSLHKTVLGEFFLHARERAEGFGYRYNVVFYPAGAVEGRELRDGEWQTSEMIEEEKRTTEDIAGYGGTAEARKMFNEWMRTKAPQPYRDLVRNTIGREEVDETVRDIPHKVRVMIPIAGENKWHVIETEDGGAVPPLPEDMNLLAESPFGQYRIHEMVDQVQRKRKFFIYSPLDERYLEKDGNWTDDGHAFSSREAARRGFASYVESDQCPEELRQWIGVDSQKMKERQIASFAEREKASRALRTNPDWSTMKLDPKKGIYRDSHLEENFVKPGEASYAITPHPTGQGVFVTIIPTATMNLPKEERYDEHGDLVMDGVIHPVFENLVWDEVAKRAGISSWIVPDAMAARAALQQDTESAEIGEYISSMLEKRFGGKGKDESESSLRKFLKSLGVPDEEIEKAMKDANKL